MRPPYEQLKGLSELDPSVFELYIRVFAIYSWIYRVGRRVEGYLLGQVELGCFRFHHFSMLRIQACLVLVALKRLGDDSLEAKLLTPALGQTSRLIKGETVSNRVHMGNIGPCV